MPSVSFLPSSLRQYPNCIASLHIIALRISQATQPTAHSPQPTAHSPQLKRTLTGGPLPPPPLGIGASVTSPAVALFLHRAFVRLAIKSDLSGAQRTQQPAAVFHRRPRDGPLGAGSSIGSTTITAVRKPSHRGQQRPSAWRQEQER